MLHDYTGSIPIQTMHMEPRSEQQMGQPNFWPSELPWSNTCHQTRQHVALGDGSLDLSRQINDARFLHVASDLGQHTSGTRHAQLATERMPFAHVLLSSTGRPPAHHALHSSASQHGSLMLARIFAPTPAAVPLLAHLVLCLALLATVDARYSTGAVSPAAGGARHKPTLYMKRCALSTWGFFCDTKRPGGILLGLGRRMSAIGTGTRDACYAWWLATAGRCWSGDDF
jgi:hypothetical protein